MRIITYKSEAMTLCCKKLECLLCTSMGNLESPINPLTACFWEEGGVRGENPDRYRENVQTLHRGPKAAPICSHVEKHDSIHMHRRV